MQVLAISNYCSYMNCNMLSFAHLFCGSRWLLLSPPVIMPVNYCSQKYSELKKKAQKTDILFVDNVFRASASSLSKNLEKYDGIEWKRPKVQCYTRWASGMAPADYPSVFFGRFFPPGPLWNGAILLNLFRPLNESSIVIFCHFLLISAVYLQLPFQDLLTMSLCLNFVRLLPPYFHVLVFNCSIDRHSPLPTTFIHRCFFIPISSLNSPIFCHFSY